MHLLSIIYIMCAFQIFFRRIRTARRKREQDDVDRLINNRPDTKLDGIVRERYPTFIAAIRDLDDCMCMCSAFAVLPRSRIVRRQTIDMCRRLTAEFMHFVIESHSLRKVFVSIKGISLLMTCSSRRRCQF